MKLSFDSEGKERNRHDHGNNVEINYETSSKFAQYFADYLLPLANTGFPKFVEYLRVGCQTAPDFVDSVNIHLAAEAERQDMHDAYWQFWTQLSDTLQDIAHELAAVPLDGRFQDDRRKLIRSMLKADVDWQPIDIENQNIALGKDLLLTFVKNAGKNPNVFEALARLMFYFPEIFFQAGVHILAKHQQDEGGTRLLSGKKHIFLLRAGHPALPAGYRYWPVAKKDARINLDLARCCR